MTMRANVQRNGTTDKNAWGHKDASDFRFHGEIACRAYSKSRDWSQDENRSASEEELRMIFPKDSDLTEADRISSITDRRGVVLHEGPLEILTIQFKRAHKMAKLRLIQIDGPGP